MIIAYVTIAAVLVTVILFISYNARCAIPGVSCSGNSMDDTAGKLSSASCLMSSITIVLIIGTGFSGISNLDSKTQMIIYGVLAVLCIVSTIYSRMTQK